MKRMIIGALAGAVLWFMLQAMSYMVSPIHKGMLKYTPAQDSILKVLTATLKEDGMYSVPNVDPSLPNADELLQKQMEEANGKPAAMISFEKAVDANMGKQMGIGIVLHLVTFFIICFLLWNSDKAMASFMSRFIFMMAISVIVIFQDNLMDFNWMNTPVHFWIGETIDRIIFWGISSAVVAAIMKRG